ncbi:MAG TPA: YCF48-related protein [Bacteroidota bacterium]|nr:YCF48-related protein [Bacteroidota bacterium]
MPTQRVFLSYRIFLCLFVLSLLAILQPRQASAQCWVYVRSGTAYDLNAIAFADSLKGTAVGANGVMVGTTDGGSTWTPERTLLNIDLKTISFADNHYGVITADTNAMLTTADGGTTWHTQRIDPTIYYMFPMSLSDLDATHLASYLQCNSPTSVSGIYVTSDAGSTWTKTSSLQATVLSFGTPLVGTLLGYNGLYRTTDGGVSWNYSLSVTNGTGASSFGADITLAAQFNSTSMHSGLFRTNDGGQHWVLQDTLLPIGNNAVSMDDSSNATYASQFGQARVTNDAGVTWSSVRAVPYQLNSVAYAGHGSVYAVGPGGLILKMVQNCNQLPVPVSPPNGIAHQSLTQSQTGHYYVPLQWNYPAYAHVSQTRIQAGTDSAFVTGIMIDTTFAAAAVPPPTSIELVTVFPGHTYFWRINVDFTDSTTTGWNGPWKFTTGVSSFSGMVFNDLNADSSWNPGDPGFPNWKINISGKFQESVFTDSAGNYSVGGLDSGTYTVTQAPQLLWKRTFPSTDAYTITLGVHDSLPGVSFGNTYPWNTVEGTVYRDIDGNGIKDGIDPGMKGWTATMYGPDSTFVTASDSTGHYKFPHVNPGSRTIHLDIPSGWEQVLPRLDQDYSLDLQSYGNHYTTLDYSVEKIPVRTRITVTVNDNFADNQQNVWFGFRPGASYGISGVDPAATGYDFLEGEFEIPPLIPGFFDARFVDPHGGLQHFGLGSWLDIRGFTSSTQTDTFRLTFAPGYLSGGDYPMTLRWSSKEVNKAFNGPVVMVSPDGTKLNMSACSCDTLSMSIANPSISDVSIITQSPNIAANCYLRWNLVSIPEPGAGGYLLDLFPTATTHGFAYIPGTGYAIQDTLRVKEGYWVKNLACEDTLHYSPGARLLDTLDLRQGWNLIGSLSAPVAVAGISTLPAGALTSSFFGYQFGYYFADTLFPTRGYWIKTSVAAKLILNASGAANVPKAERNSIIPTDTLSIADAEGYRQNLLLADGQDKTEVGSNELPPLPPEGSFDVRFSSNRLVEFLSSTTSREIPISVHGGAFPLKITWKGTNVSLHAAVKIDGRTITLHSGSVEEISSVGSGLVLVLSNAPLLPASYSLYQNYPNPFNPSTTIRYDLPVSSHVRLKVYDLLGQLVRTLADDPEPAGYHTVKFDGSGLSSGLYFYRLEAGKYLDVKKMLIVK